MRPHHSSSQHLGGYPQPSHHGQLGPRHGSMPYEGSSNGYPPASSSRYPSGNSYYYSSSARPQPPNQAPFVNNSAAPSPSAHSYRTNASVDHPPPPLQHHSTSTMPGRRGGSVGPSPHYDSEPSYHVEHLATFAVGRQFGLLTAQDGIRKLKQMEKQSAIWAQPLLLKLKPDKVSVEDENGEIVEQFPMELIIDPTAHQTHDNMDTYNNILLFVVKEDRNASRKPIPSNPTEMHIFQCVRVSAVDVAQDMMLYSRGQIQKVRGGRRDTGYGGSIDNSPYGPLPQQNLYRDDASPSSNSSEEIDRNVNTLNRCFDDIEKFVARIQSAAMAQREIEMLRIRMRNKPRGKNEIPGILQLRAQMPQPAEFYEILQKFKLSINILTLVQNYIHDPNAPELLHFLFTPLKVIVDACNWGLGQDIAAKVVSPLLSHEANELLQQCLNNAEFDLWMSLGQYWRTSPEMWQGPPPPPYRPVFRDNFAPYGYPQQASQRQPQQMHRGSSAPPTQQYPSSRPPQRSADDIDLERVNLEKERLAFERMKILDRERRLEEEEERVRREAARIEAERQLLSIESQKARNASGNVYISTTQQAGKVSKNGNPQVHGFLSDLLKHNRKIVEVLYDRLKQHEKELTVTRGEYLEVLNDEKNWWECRNSQNIMGFVPHTILSVLRPEDVQTILNTSNGFNDPNSIPNYNPQATIESASLSPRPVPPPPPPQINGTSTATRSMIEALQNVVLRRREQSSETPMSTVNKLNTPKAPYYDEIIDTINSKKEIMLRRKLSNRGKIINKNSSVAEIQNWLIEKNFGNKIKTLFSEFNGEDMFSLDKETLIKHCGKEEGTHLFSLLLVQKKRSNYNSFSKSDRALTAILHMRREQTDNKNEASAEPDEEPPVNGPIKIKDTAPKNNNNNNNNGIIIQSKIDPSVVRKLTPPSKKVIKTQNINRSQKPEKAIQVKSPQAAPRTVPAPYNPARLANPPNDPPERRNSWIQTVKRYN